MAGGAGGHEVERIAVKVVPDTGGFKEKLKAFLERVERESKVEVEVELKGEQEAEARLKELARDVTVKVKVALENLSKVRTQLAQLLRDRTIHVDVEIDDALARARLGQSFRTRGIKITADLDLAAARVQLAAFLRPRRLKIHVDFDHETFGALFRAVAQFGRMVGQINRQMFSMGRAAGNAFQMVSNSAGGATNAMGKFKLVIIPLLVVAITILVGALVGLIIILVAVAGAILAVLPPLAALAAGLAYAFKSGDKQAKAFRKRVEGLGKTALGVVKYAVQPMMKALNAQIPVIRTWVQGLKGPLREAFKQSSRYVDDFSAGLRKFATNALGGIIRALRNPALDQAVQGFNILLADIGTAIGEFFEVLSDGGPEYKATLDALGESFKALLPALARMANVFAGFAPELIDRLTLALVSLMDVLGDEKNLAALAEFAKASFTAALGAIVLFVYGVRLAVAAIEKAKAFISSLVSSIQSLWNRFTNWLRSKWDAFTRSVLSRTSGMSSGVSGTISGMVGRITGLVGGLVGKISSFWSRITGRSRSGANQTRSAAIGPFNGMASSISGIMNRIVGIVSSAWSRISGIVSNIAGAVSRAAGLVSRLSGLASKIPSPFNLFSAPAEGDSAPTFRTFDFGGDDASTPMAMRTMSFASSVDRMMDASRDLRRKYRKLPDDDYKAVTNTKAEGPAPRIFNFTTYAAPNEPTEKQFVKWLDYAETMYAT